MFEALYGSGWQHPGMAFLGVLPVALLLGLRRPFVHAWAIACMVLSVADAYLTGSSTPVPTGARLGFSIAFVILGDLRYFVLVERFVRSAPSERPPASPRGLGSLCVWVVAIPLAFVVPLTTTLFLKAILVETLAPLRNTFLFYESTFLVLALVLRFVVMPRRTAALDPELRRWLLLVTTFEVVQYGLWVSIDVVIFSGADVGYLLRFVPNFLYYVAFVPFVYLTAPKVSGRASSAGSAAPVEG